MGEGDEGLAAFGVGIENDARQTVAGRFGQAHIAGNDGVKHPVAIVALELVAHLLLQGDARIEHDPQQADQAQISIEIGVHELDGVGEIGQPLQHCMGTITPWAAHRPLSVSRLKAGGQSMRMKS